MLREVKAYLRQREQVSARQIADRFDVDVETVEAWMAHLIRQGQVQKIEAPTCSTSGCGNCAATGPGAVLYRWLPCRYRPLRVPVDSR